jgi:16S rRNA (cytosine967-C5)-methyltransferase
MKKSLPLFFIFSLIFLSQSKAQFSKYIIRFKDKSGTPFNINNLCYNYFRLGHTVKNISTEERILLGTFLCENQNEGITQLQPPDTLSQFFAEEIFLFKDELSDGIDYEKFSQSFLIQPKLFLRIRPGYKNKVTGKLSGAGIPYKLLSDDCIALPNASKINEIIQLDKEAVVQDYNSQKVGEFLRLSTINHELSTVWDCCAASGGKSIMAYDINPNIHLTVSDKRESILKNLKERFKIAGIKNYISFIADVNDEGNVKTAFSVPIGFDMIIADVPCTGSGTWARTPEQLYFFKKKSIEDYAILQKKIISNVVKYLKHGGKLLYITCSVFKKENEEVVEFAIKNHNLKLEKQELLKGYEMQADTMFAALLTVP